MGSFKEWMRDYRVKACETEECLVRLVTTRVQESWSKQRQDAAAAAAAAVVQSASQSVSVEKTVSESDRSWTLSCDVLHLRHDNDSFCFSTINYKLTLNILLN